MYKKIVLLLLLAGIQIMAVASPVAFTGKVTDAITKEVLPGASVSIPELRISASANSNGEFTFTNIPGRGKFVVEIKYIGYKTLTQQVDFATSGTMEFALQPSVIETREVVVTGTASGSDNAKNSTSVSVVSKDQLINRGSNNLIDAVAKVAGVSQVTTGASISKPVIRGLSYNRVVTLVNGAKQEGQQWGDEHGIEVDQYAADRVEVLRGAASLLYGSDAIGGVINILDPLPPAEGQVRGEFLSNYSTNNGLTATSAMIQGNSKGFVWRGRGTYKDAFGYAAPGGRIPNTGFDETSLSAQLGFNKKWGYTHLDLSSFRTKLGLPDFERNAAGRFEDENGQEFSEAMLKDRTLLLPFQDVRHYKVALNSHFFFGKGNLKSVFAYQNNQRRELEETRTDPSLFFDLKTYSYDLKYYFQNSNGWEPVIGVSGAFQDNVNKAEELLVPDYTSSDVGAFAYIKKTWNQSTFNAGLRFDYRNIAGVAMEEEGSPKFSDFENNFSNLSGALGFTHEFNENFSFKTNVGTAFRAPNIAELSSDGVHEGTFRYEIGNTGLTREQSYYADAAFKFSNDKVDASFGVFNNYIDHYIYTRQNGGETIVVDTETFPVYRYTQDNANLHGFEAEFTLHPSKVLHFENNFTYTRGTNRATDAPLPFIPAAILRNELRIEPGIKGLSNTYFSVGLDNVFKQNRIDSFETPTDGYTLVNASVGTGFKLGNQLLRLNVSANNLFDKAYVDHLSRLKYEDILNQGRNVTFGLYIPFKSR